jgi:hypothetical protein
MYADEGSFSNNAPVLRNSEEGPCTLKADSHIACCSPAAKGLERVFPIWFRQRGHIWFTLAMPHPCHPLPCRSSQGHGTVEPSRDGLWASARVRLLPANTRSSTKLLSAAFQSQMQVASVKPNTVCHGWGKKGQQHTTKKMICYTAGLVVRIFPTTMPTFTKDTALS